MLDVRIVKGNDTSTWPDVIVQDVPANISATCRSSNCEHFSRFHLPVSIQFPVTWYEISLRNGTNRVKRRILYPRNRFWPHDYIFNDSSAIVKIRRGGAPRSPSPLAVRVLRSLSILSKVPFSDEPRFHLLLINCHFSPTRCFTCTCLWFVAKPKVKFRKEIEKNILYHLHEKCGSKRMVLLHWTR